ncbi:MAG: hypothetical protein Kow0031_00350 [Anaerolineae bacterium]
MPDAKTIAQLENELAGFGNGSAAEIHRKIDVMNDLAWRLSDVNLKRAQRLAEAALSLSENPADDMPPHGAGLARSLRTLGYLNQRLGDYPQGMSQLLKAQELCERLQLDETLADVFDGIAGIYYQIGNFPEMLDFSYRQLEAARRIGDRQRIANAYNNLANIYFETGDFDRAADTLHQNLLLATEIGYKRIEVLSYLNLAETYILAGNNVLALQNARLGLASSRDGGFELFQVYALDLTGKAYLNLGDADLAVDHLQQALVQSQKTESKVTEALILLNLGHAYREARQLDLALDYLHRSVATAETINARSELFKCHLLLSEIYEQTGKLELALAHYKQYHAFKAMLFGEKADERLKVLQVAHDTETTKKEAEILQLKTAQLEREVAERGKIAAALQVAHDKLEYQVRIRTAELSDTVQLLQQEIEERQRAEGEIQQLLKSLEQRVAARTRQLATFFDLTVLAGHATSLTDVYAQAVPRILEVTGSRVICIHLFNPEGFCLKLTAQQNLPPNAHPLLECVPLSPELFTWLEQPGDPLLSMGQAGMAILPPAFHLSQFQSYLGAQIRVGPTIKGLLSCYRFTGRGFSLDEVSLVVALAEQMGMVLETDRLRQVAGEVAVLEERQRLARDLHDSVTQSIYSLTLFARSAREVAEDDDLAELVSILTDIEETSVHTLREMRLLLYQLRAPLLAQEGLVQTLDTRLDLVERRTGLQVSYEVDPNWPALSHAVGQELYRLAVEALNNVIKHAESSQISVRLCAANNRASLTIADNGRGFDPAQANTGFGLKGMKERAARLGGKLNIASEPGRGTSISVEFEPDAGKVPD